ncbi:hypothetical protein ACGFT2_23090 [Streptomyces sp. NPDC048514]|uniref:hypothetical protein n=1 Tax=Streptomyces sp. NPDC048514 TaxID=3365564 RepID=UPI0037217438
MIGQRARRLFAGAAVSVLMAGGTAVGLAGTASAATPTNVPTHNGCSYRGGFWYGGCNGFGNGFGNRSGFYGNGYYGGGGVVVILLG